MVNSLEGLRLDKHCVIILMVLTEQQHTFNKLHKALKERGVEMSKPTLSSHLKHLVRAEYVRREEIEGSQLVTYSVVNSERIEKIKGISEQMRSIVKDSVSKSKWGKSANEKEFFSLSEDEQMKTVLDVLVGRKLNEIKARIAYELEPKNFENQFALLFWTSSFVTVSEYWVIKKCVKDEEYRKNVLKIIDKWL